VGDSQNSGSSLLALGRRIVIVVIVGRMIVAVFADVEVEVEETGAELAVAVPVASGVQAQAANAYDNYESQDRAGQPGTSDHGSAETSHLGSMLILTDFPHPDRFLDSACGLARNDTGLVSSRADMERSDGVAEVSHKV
jgi:hypothetical protein